LENENEYVLVGILRLIQFLFFWSLYELLFFCQTSLAIHHSNDNRTADLGLVDYIP